MLQTFGGRTEDVRAFALKHRVLLLEASNAVPLDVSLGAIPYEERVVARSSRFSVGEGSTLVTCSAEDLVILKTVAAREQDWLDIRGISARQAGRLDQPLIERELRPLLDLKGDPEALPRLREILATD